MVPHQFEEIFGTSLTPSEKYFYIILRKLENRFAIKTGERKGWFWHVDRSFKTSKGEILGFNSFGFSPSFTQRTRKKLKELNLIEIKKGRSKGGYRGGTFYRINDDMLDFSGKEPDRSLKRMDPPKSFQSK